MQALEKGAAYAVVDEETGSNDSRLLRVANVLESLQLLAKYHRQQFAIPFLAITGSNGKTTTKELISAVLSTGFTTYFTQGNLNNHIGVPLTLLSIAPDAEIAVIEMGANHLKEIEGYCNIAAPTHGIITNCGKAHLEGFGSEEGVRRGKGELYDYLRQHRGTAFVYADHNYLVNMANGIETIETYGTQQGNVVGRLLQSEFFLRVEVNLANQIEIINTHLVGGYNLPNVLCAVAVGQHFKVPLSKIKAAIEHYVPGNSRSQMTMQGTNKIILDAYNANPSSMEVAIENLAKEKVDKKVLMLGAMMELGSDSIAEHQKIIDFAGQYKWSDIVLVGGDFKNINHGYTYFSTAAEAAKWFKAQKFENACILVKGSRSIKMEQIVAL